MRDCQKHFEENKHNDMMESKGNRVFVESLSSYIYLSSLTFTFSRRSGYASFGMHF